MYSMWCLSIFILTSIFNYNNGNEVNDMSMTDIGDLPGDIFKYVTKQSGKRLKTHHHISASSPRKNVEKPEDSQIYEILVNSHNKNQLNKRVQFADTTEANENTYKYIPSVNAKIDHEKSPLKQIEDIEQPIIKSVLEKSLLEKIDDQRPITKFVSDKSSFEKNEDVTTPVTKSVNEKHSLEGTVNVEKPVKQPVIEKSSLKPKDNIDETVTEINVKKNATGINSILDTSRSGASYDTDDDNSWQHQIFYPENINGLKFTKPRTSKRKKKPNNMQYQNQRFHPGTSPLEYPPYYPPAYNPYQFQTLSYQYPYQYQDYYYPYSWSYEQQNPYQLYYLNNQR